MPNEDGVNQLKNFSTLSGDHEQDPIQFDSFVGSVVNIPFELKREIFGCE